VQTTPTKFTDSAVLSRGRIVEHQMSQTQETALLTEDGSYYRLRNLKDLEYAIEPAQVSSTDDSTPNLAASSADLLDLTEFPICITNLSILGRQSALKTVKGGPRWPLTP
jgi:hypothetical protein